MTDVTRPEGGPGEREAGEGGTTSIIAPGNTSGNTSGITLAECGGQYWVVGGEEHLDAMLTGDMPPGVGVEVLPCADQAAVFATWAQRSPDAEEGALPWALNPRLMGGLLGRLGLAPGTVRFAPWSAAMDADAAAAIAGAAAWLAGHAGGTLLLRQFLPAAPQPGQAELQRLRLQLVRGALEREGAAPAALREEVAPAEGKASPEQLLIACVPGP